MKNYNLDDAIRKVADFPKPGILFYDITGILITPPAFSYCIEAMVEEYKNKDITAVAAIEARGFLFAAPFAEKVGLPLILVRKKGKLPGEKISRTFELEYGQDVIQVHKNDIEKGSNILIVDDLVATGGTLSAAAEIFKEAGAKVNDIFCVVGLPFLNYKKVLGEYRIKTLIEYDSE